MIKSCIEQKIVCFQNNSLTHTLDTPRLCYIIYHIIIFNCFITHSFITYRTREPKAVTAILFHPSLFCSCFLETQNLNIPTYTTYPPVSFHIIDSSSPEKEFSLPPLLVLTSKPRLAFLGH